MKEGGKIVRCPKCGSSKVTDVPQFDYVKQCNNIKCPYRLDPKNAKKGWRYQWSTGVHN